MFWVAYTQRPRTAALDRVLGVRLDDVSLPNDYCRKRAGDGQEKKYYFENAI